MIKVRINTKEAISSLLIAMIVVLNVVSSLYGYAGILNGPIGQIGNLCIIAIVYLINRDPLEDRRLSLYLCIAICLWLFSVLSGLMQGFTSYLKPLMLLELFTNILLAYVLINKNVSIAIIKCLFYGVSAYFLYTCYILQTNPFHIFSSSAGGMLNTVTMCLAFLVQYLEYRERNAIIILPSVIVFCLSVYSLSRTALLVSVIYLFVVIFIWTRGIKNKFIKNVLVIILLAAIALVIYSKWDYISTWGIYDKFEVKGMSLSGRESIWTEYFDSLNIFTVLLGRVIDENHALAGLTNPHNSFIGLHSQIGIFALPVYYLIIRQLSRLLKKNRYMFFLLLLLCLRCFFDNPFFFQNCDFVFYIFLFGISDNSQTSEEKYVLKVI